MIRLRVDAGVSCGDKQHLIGDFWTLSILGHKGQGCGHVAPNGVAGNGNPSAVSAKILRMRGDPFQRRVAFIQLGWIFRSRQGRVFDEDADLTRSDHKVA